MNFKRRVFHPDCHLNSNVWNSCWLMFRPRLTRMITIFKINTLFRSKVWHFSCVDHLDSIHPPSVCNSAYICRILDRLCSSICVYWFSLAFLPLFLAQLILIGQSYQHNPYHSVIQPCWNHHITAVFEESIRLPFSFSSTWTGKAQDHAILSSQWDVFFSLFHFEMYSSSMRNRMNVNHVSYGKTRM
jgi:hypothetical protein